MTQTASGIKKPRLAIDVMGADGGVEVVVEGLARALGCGLDADITLVGREPEIRAVLAAHETGGANIEIMHADDVISMEEKPSNALRRGRKSSMWHAIAAVKCGAADAALSSGNTGALMAMSVLQLRKIDGIDRPAISALWPTLRGSSVVLDVGANIEVSAKQLVQFAVMGEAYFRARTGKDKPTVGLLNVGAEELKGHATIRTAAAILRESNREMAFVGFVEGNDISTGRVDVVVTDGFTGNIALKTAEGTAHLIGNWLKGALTSSLLSKLAALLMMPSLKNLKARMDPSSVNGAPLLGLNGLVMKSHGGADAAGVQAAIERTARLARHPFQTEIAQNAARIARRETEKPTPNPTDKETAQAAE
ncbi:MAG: phosphate acyltransferase PlsX [Parvularcula sp.]